MLFETFDSVVSTMDTARRLALAGNVVFDAANNPTPAGVLARHQTAGRGQRGRAWHDEPGAGLCVTLYFRSEQMLRETPGLIALLTGAAVAAALTDWIAAQNPVHQPCVGLKWPNDVLLNDKKVGGILIEMAAAQDGTQIALIGIGVNLTMQALPPDTAPSATSLAMENIAAPAPETLAKIIAANLKRQAEEWKCGGNARLISQWRRFDATAGRSYETTWKDRVVQGTAGGVDETGALLLTLHDGRHIAVLSASGLRELPKTAS